VGLAAKRAGIGREIVGVGRRQETLDVALARGAIDRASTSLESGIEGANFVVVCTPVAQIVDFVERIVAANPQALVTDVGSTKQQIVATLSESLPAPRRYIGSHPMAGDSKTGPEHARDDLFVDRVVVVTPAADDRDELVTQLDEFWQALGASVVRMSPEDHDRAVAAVSHLPHLIASAIAGSTPEGYFPLIATGWRDATRIAAGDPAMWRQIFEQNRANVAASLARFEQELAEWRAALAAGDGPALEALLKKAKRNRDAVGS
jgi:prephenate dehydrogenase